MTHPFARGGQVEQQTRSDDNPFAAAAAGGALYSTSSGGTHSVEYKPLVPCDTELLQTQVERSTTPSDSFSTQRVTGLTTDGGDDLDDLEDDVNTPGGRGRMMNGFGGGGGGRGGLVAPGGGDLDGFRDFDRGVGDDVGDYDDEERRRHGAGLILDGCRNLLVMCDTFAPGTMTPLPTNTRAAAAAIFDAPNVAAEEPWFGIEQEYTLLDATTRWPIGWPPGGYPAPQGPYYCGVGADRMFGRSIAEAHYTACHFAGLDVGGRSRALFSVHAHMYSLN